MSESYSSLAQQTQGLAPEDCSPSGCADACTHGFPRCMGWRRVRRGTSQADRGARGSHGHSDLSRSRLRQGASPDARVKALEFHPEAAAELEDAARFYNERGEGLGLRFEALGGARLSIKAASTERIPRINKKCVQAMFPTDTRPVFR